MSTASMSVRHELGRLVFRLELVWHAVVTATLWLGIAYAYSRLAEHGLELLVVAALVPLSSMALKILLLQTGLLVDLAAYTLFRTIAFYPVVMKIAEVEADKRRARGEPDREMPWTTRSLIRCVDALSPLSVPAMWALTVIERLPVSAHISTAEYAVDSPHQSAARDLRRYEGTMVQRSVDEGAILAA